MPPSTGADNLAACADLLELLDEQRRSGRYYAAICASPLIVFERHGLLYVVCRVLTLSAALARGGLRTLGSTAS